jgi:molybdopterin-binding protein
MNRLKGTISSIITEKSISFVEIRVGSDTFSCFLLETPETCRYLKIDGAVSLLFKETEVSVARELGIISIRNRIKNRISAITYGTVVAQLEFDYCGVPIRSIISTRAARELDLKVGDEVWWLLKSNELSLMEG